MRFVGIDLAGVENRPTGFCVIDEQLNTETRIIYKDIEIIEKISKIKPKIVAIDAPLALPKGRKSLHRKSNIHLRKCDKQLLRMRIKFFPITLGPMRKLTKRGMKIRKSLENNGFKVIETYPGAAQDLLKIERKQKGVEKLRKSLMKFGFKGDIDKENITDHELDAITCAFVGKMYVEKKSVAIGDPEEILMILPKTG